MHKDEKSLLILAVVLLLPFMFWRLSWHLTPYRDASIWDQFNATPYSPIALVAIGLGFCAAGLFVWAIGGFTSREFKGGDYEKHLRGAEIVSDKKLSRLTRPHSDQITIGGIPVPRHVEPLHFLLNGSTGTGKSVLIREMVYKALVRGDKMIIIDPNGDMVSKFYRKGDYILNPFDKRSPGWSIFNEIREDYDYVRFAKSIVPLGLTNDAEDWNKYARLLLSETAKKIHLLGESNVSTLQKWTNEKPPAELHQFLQGTQATTLFAGNADGSRALQSARFILSDKITAHMYMKSGNFSLRAWLEDEKAGTLFITWREDMADALRPLISAWTDILCSSVLSLPEDPNRNLWLVIDELASMDKLASLEPALTKGRKHGLRVISGLQTVSQLESIYGPADGQTLRSCYRSLIVLGGAATDPKTAEEMSLGLGEHEVLKHKYSRSLGSMTARDDRSSKSVSFETEKARVVAPSEITNLKNLEAFVKFGGDYPVGRVQVTPITFKTCAEAFQPNEVAA